MKRLVVLPGLVTGGVARADIATPLPDPCVGKPRGAACQYRPSWGDLFRKQQKLEGSRLGRCERVLDPARRCPSAWRCCRTAASPRPAR